MIQCKDYRPTTALFQTGDVMLKKFLLLIIAVICFAPAEARARDVIVVQGLAVKPYDEALRGFRSVCAEEVTKLYLADLEGKDLTGLIQEEKAKLILAIGPEALKRVKEVREVPVIYLMVVSPKQMSKGNRDITGVTMNAPAKKYLDLLSRISPRPKTVGIIYDPTKSRHLVKRAQQAAREQGLQLLTREVRKSKEVAAALHDLNGSVDLLWMLPDTTVVTPETVELFLLVSHERRVPVISFAAKYVEMGALAALVIDSYDQGQQAAEMARDILDGKPVAEVPRAEARAVTLKINQHVARKLGLTINP